MEKLALVFTNGYHTQLAVIFENENIHSDLQSLIERVFYEIIEPKKYYGLVVYEDDMESYGLEYDEEDGGYNDMIYIDKGYYIACETFHVLEFSDEQIKEYQNNNIEVIVLND